MSVLNPAKVAFARDGAACYAQGVRRAPRVMYFQRKPYSDSFSLERVFNSVRTALPSNMAKAAWTCPFESRGVARRLLNLVEATFHQGEINHITGDVHYLALGLAKRKTILTIPDCVGPRFSKGLKRLALVMGWYRLPARRVAAITVISEFTRKEVLRYTGCAPELVRVIHCPVPDGFAPFPKPFNAQRPVLLQVGAAEHNKNICRVAEAIRGIPCRLDIIGRLTDRQRQALEHNSISYSEQWGLADQEVVQRYRDCDVVVFASTYEGFGMPILEGNATGRPVVTSNVCSMPEVAGSAACLVDPFDCSSIREGILRVINDCDYRNNLIAQGFENVKRFRADSIAAQYAALYHEVLSRSSGG
jgi:glycosyltransferase involved in cell wall biosynthesis